MRLVNRRFNQCVVGRRKMFLWHLHQLKQKLMMVIIRASDQVTTNLVGRQRSRTTTQWYGNPVLEVMLLNNNEPTSYGEAMVGPDSDKWLEAMKSERGSMYENKVQTLEELLDGRKTIKYRWIFKRKTYDDGEKSPLRKSRLVAKMFPTRSKS